MCRAQRKKVVVVGGGFAGRRAYQLLVSRFDTQLIDAKGYYEYTPANLRCLVEPVHAAGTVQEQPAATLVDIVTDVLHNDTPSRRGVLQLQSGKRLSFDFCILCLGSDYAAPIKAIQSVQTTCRERRQAYAASHAELCAARSILIIGGGDVGVELAAEIVGKWRCGKQVTLVSSQSRVLAHMPPAASAFAAAWLQRRGVLLVLGQRAVARGAGTLRAHAPAGVASPGHVLAGRYEAGRPAARSAVVLDDGRHLTADLLFWCTGERPASMAFPGLLAAAARDQPGAAAGGVAAGCRVSPGQPRVLQSLQLAGAPNVFAAGDCAVAEGLRTAFAAELSAGLAARNIMRLASGKPLLRFPEDACHGARRLPKIAAVSLYKFDGVLQFNRLVLHGFAAVATKWLVEYLQDHAFHPKAAPAQVHAARGSRLHAVAWDWFEAVGAWSGARLFA